MVEVIVNKIDNSDKITDQEIFLIPVERSRSFKTVTPNRFFLNSRYDDGALRVLISFQRRDPRLKNIRVTQTGISGVLKTSVGTSEVGVPETEWSQTEEVAIELSAGLASELAEIIRLHLVDVGNNKIG